MIGADVRGLLEKIAPRGPQGRLHVVWFDAWEPALDDALRELPEMEGCPHDLYRRLIEHRTGARKKTALITERGAPVAVVGLRVHQRHWEPVTQAVVPWTIIPCKDGYLFPSLAAVNLDVWMKYQPELPVGPYVRQVVSFPTYKIDARTDFEAFWRSTGIFKDIRQARNRTAGFAFEVDNPDAVTWTIGRWAEKWADHPGGETAVAGDLRLASEYRQRTGGHHVFRLLDGEVPVAGRTFFVNGSQVVTSCAYYAPEYRRLGVGNRLYELFFRWVAASAYDGVNLGGGHAYKARWAPEDGMLHTYNVAPVHVHLAQTALRTVGRMGRNLLRRGRPWADGAGH